MSEWLAAFAGESSAIGDLARDAAADPGWPQGPHELGVFREHVEDQGAVEAALEGLEQAWEQYEVWS
ncbi:YozE family protein [Streptomyces virginiae]|uniref:YozE family protein n=1 Tax=Streptomyces virginiae TaxID=1961 RepID=UPI0032442CEB